MIIRMVPTITTTTITRMGRGTTMPMMPITCTATCTRATPPPTCRCWRRQFIDGFTKAADKTSYLKLAGVPFERPGQGGATALKLVDVELTTDWQIGTASPSFGSRELSYLPFPGEMVRERTNLKFVYVSMAEKSTLDLRDFLSQKMEEIDR